MGTWASRAKFEITLSANEKTLTKTVTMVKMKRLRLQ